MEDQEYMGRWTTARQRRLVELAEMRRRRAANAKLAARVSPERLREAMRRADEARARHSKEGGTSNLGQEC